MPDPQPLVSIILVSYNDADVLPACLQSLQAFSQTVSYEIIVVDNASPDGSTDGLAQQFPGIKILSQPTNLGFGAGNNAGSKVAKGEFLLLLNPDTCLTEEILPHLLEIMADPTVGIVGPKLLNLDGSLQLSTSPAISIWGEYRAQKRLLDMQIPARQGAIAQEFTTVHPVDIVVGAAFLIRRQLFEQLGGFDQRFFMYFEESDLCQRAKNAGWQVMYTPKVSLIHLKGHASQQIPDRIRLEYRRSQLYYYQKHRPLWEQLVLRLYLLSKFGIAFCKSFQAIDRQILWLTMNLRQYPLRIAN